ncbi:MAG TPA: hypothetical protein VFG25_06635 [Nitrosopumilaceae archaeon]|nr:hypothetical protein [Nitrosopumilaceae archaeon]
MNSITKEVNWIVIRRIVNLAIPIFNQKKRLALDFQNPAVKTNPKIPIDKRSVAPRAKFS